MHKAHTSRQGQDPLPPSSKYYVVNSNIVIICRGVDSHVHIHQENTPTGDTWETGSRSAIAGGNTTVIAFATQKRQETSIWAALEAYHTKATGNSYCDYGFHLILTNPSETVLEEELPLLLEEGVSSVKLYMTCNRPDLQSLILLEKGLIISGWQTNR